MADTLAEHLAWSTVQQGADLPDLATVIGRPEWMRDALCQERPTTGFFPEQGERLDDAKATCRACLVQEECLAYALEERIEHGVWGGTSNRERLRLRSRQRAA